METPIHSLSVSLICGAFAGLAVDMTLYPIDTIKTRLQSQLGFKKSGGFRAIYAGIPSVAIGSAPGSALFFLTYETVKAGLKGVPYQTLHHMAAASIGEVVACLIRVPTEVVKQRTQAFQNYTTRQIFRNIMQKEGLEGLYRGFSSTVAREVPFSLIEFPVWEHLKYKWSAYQGRPVSPWQGAACGSLSGAFAAGLTTPLDVAKTRIMLSEKLHKDKLTVRAVLSDVYKTKGIRGLYAGFYPRVTWMALGGFIFFGAYEKAKELWTFHSDKQNVVYKPRTLDSIFKLGYEYWFMDEIRKKGPKTFDDVIEEAKQVQARRDAAWAALLAKREQDAKKHS